VGSPRVISDAGGNIVKVLEYDSFGNPLSDSNPGFALPVGFAGGLRDAVSGLIRFGLRDYDPAAGRWTARDPLQFGASQANLYVYLGDDPVNGRDPSGFFKMPKVLPTPNTKDIRDATGRAIKARDAIKDINDLNDFLNDPNQSQARKAAAQLRCFFKYAPWTKMSVLGLYYQLLSQEVLEHGLDAIEGRLDKLDDLWDKLNKEYFYRDPCAKSGYPKKDKRRKLPCD